jgi:hypothetical protein
VRMRAAQSLKLNATRPPRMINRLLALAEAEALGVVELAAKLKNANS